MSVVVFYHLTRSAPLAVLTTILPRALAQGWRVMVRGSDAGSLAELDLALWQLGDDSFLPHGIEDAPHAGDQPILLGRGPIANAAQGLVLLDGAELIETEVSDLQRVWVLFDGNDPQALTAARSLWTRVTTAGQGAQYWSEEGGQWEKRAEKPSAAGTV